MPTRRNKQLEASHVRREVKTALELAIMAFAPHDIVNELAAIAGLLEALSEVPVESPPSIALLPKVLARARSSLENWQSWEKKHQKPSA
jgi:hypothetical protein